MSVDLSQYATLQFWALGHTTHTPSRLKTIRRWKSMFLGNFTGVPAEEQSVRSLIFTVNFWRMTISGIILFASGQLPPSQNLWPKVTWLKSPDYPPVIITLPLPKSTKTLFKIPGKNRLLNHIVIKHYCIYVTVQCTVRNTNSKYTD